VESQAYLAIVSAKTAQILHVHKRCATVQVPAACSQLISHVETGLFGTC